MPEHGAAGLIWGRHSRESQKQDIRIRFGIAVRKRRSGLGISQEELADRAELHRTYIADIERGTRTSSGLPSFLLQNRQDPTA
jgi:ribosome-binding protein aMBF1 (putative translation factor)